MSGTLSAFQKRFEPRPEDRPRSTSNEVFAQGTTSQLDSVGRVVNTTPGGLYALATNSGRQQGGGFSVVPEVELKLNYRLTDRIDLFAGYSFLYWSNLVRPGDQINRRIDPRQLPSSLAFNATAAPSQPSSLFNRSDFWAQGINVGIILRF